ncbi:hypothetical protein MYSTI_01795 [Myxococcus stipitatus DSM 14675]|uniref:DUF2169 domain-containing protein n=1 Tax=Myxococcus stipitatus (strain DSM 14675 / JCM 12634 / Mx s8) TaxID=1278073 RepID=L7U6A7_MYXSD|nr:DUF2169 domain-containing protein [Myxococcus stipitatus]AGC43127.1 hypothetical protein MYSTI_01795 [Myxococcus stipitatus DSM 14675]
MWSIDNQTPFAVERTWVRDKSGRHHWVVAVKGTFVIGVNGQLSIAEEQYAPLHVPEYRGVPGSSSLRYEADLIPSKPTTDILINAHAHAPEGRPAPQVVVSLRVGTLRKTLVVYGERVYVDGVLGSTRSSPAPFLSKPVIYENAFGGTDTSERDFRKHRVDARNPIGRGLIGRVAPFVEYPDGDESKPWPTGFGAIASHWSPRLKFAGTYDEHWEKNRRPLLPEDYDERFLLCSPADQRPSVPMTGGERIELTNLSPERLLRFELPRVTLRFRTYFGRKVQAHEGHLASVIIEPEESRLLLVWHSMLGVGALDAEYLDRTVIEARTLE